MQMPFDKDLLTRMIVAIEDDGSEITQITHLGDNVFKMQVTNPGGAGPMYGSGYEAVFWYETGSLKRKGTGNIWMS